MLHSTLRKVTGRHKIKVDSLKVMEKLDYMMCEPLKTYHAVYAVQLSNQGKPVPPLYSQLCWRGLT